jgi:hypothetical protein
MACFRDRFQAVVLQFGTVVVGHALHVWRRIDAHPVQLEAELVAVCEGASSRFGIPRELKHFPFVGKGKLNSIPYPILQRAHLLSVYVLDLAIGKYLHFTITYANFNMLRGKIKLIL